MILLRSFHELSHILPLAQGAWGGGANRRPPLHPRALANKIAAARCPRLIPYGYRVGDFDATNTGAVCN
ncbi:hypothetical protein CEB44_23595 [Escherichia coli]|nr:hypothetical protein CEB44_23595 [Escherichia coli]